MSPAEPDRTRRARTPAPGGGLAAPDDEESLVHGLVAGRPAAVASFLGRSHHRVYAIACRITQDRDRRSDWTHDTLLGLVADVRRGRFEYRGPGSFWGWFRKRAYFRLLDEYRKAKLAGERERAAGGADELSGLSPLTGAPDALDELERVRVRSALETCLRRLANEQHRRALELRLLEDRTYERIAEDLDAPLNTVRAWIRRGRLALRKCLVTALGLMEPQPSSSPDPFSSRGDAS